MSEKIPYKDIIDRIKDDVDYIADEAYTKGYTDGRKQAKTQAELDVAHDIENVAKENYQKGLEDAWECAKKITCLESDGGMPCRVLADIFDGEGMIIANYSASEAMAKIKAYEDEQKQIRVGDEVKNRIDVKAVILGEHTTIKKLWRVFKENGYTEFWQVNEFEKTGRHFDGIETMMEKMRGEE